MSTVVCIEFDLQMYPTSLNCIQWLRSSDYASLPQLKNFKLKAVSQSTFISKEPRKVWQWKNDAWKYRRFVVDRPQPHIYVVLADSEPHYTLQDIPTLSAKFAAKEQDELKKQDERDKRFIERRAKMADARRERQEEKRRNRSRAVADGDPLETEKAKLERKEETRKRKRAEKAAEARKKRDKAREQAQKLKNKENKRKRTKRIKKEDLLSDEEQLSDTDPEVDEEQASLAKQVKEAAPVPKLNGTVLKDVPVPESAL